VGQSKLCDHKLFAIINTVAIIEDKISSNVDVLQTSKQKLGIKKLMPSYSLLEAHYKHHKHRFLTWVSLHKKLAYLYGVLILLVLTAGAVGAYSISHKKPPLQKPIMAAVIQKLPPVIPPPPKPKSVLTGLEVENDSITKRQVTAIMIENSPAARPQSGIKTAGVVFEAIAEGGITRFLTLFQESRPGLIGPVRSLRPYYIDWLAPFDAAVAHVGGSYNALNEIRSGLYKDIDQFFNGNSYWRASDRYAPHNVYTNFDKLDELNKSKGYITSSFTGFARKAEAPVAVSDASKIDIDISSADFAVHYDYDKPTNSYLRSEGGQVHNDREGGQLAPKVAIVIKVPMHTGFEDGYREQMDTFGSGPAYVFQDGTITQGIWDKPNRTSQIGFKDGSGKAIALNPGQTWITVIPTEKNVTWQ
jgi:hypothetical protein